MTSLGQYANGRTIECELLKASKIEAEIDITELNTQSVSLEDKWKIYLDANDSFIIKNEIQNVISLTADGLTGDVTLHGSGGGGAENLTDLQDVCATALNGQMFYYNATASKYEFTNNIINNESTNTISITSLSGGLINTTELSANEISCNILKPNICVANTLLSSPLITTNTLVVVNEISANEISCNVLNYNTLNPPISISTNLTDLQDVCATALNGQMFYYNQVTGKYEFTNNIINDETNSRIIINEISSNEINTLDISTQILTIDNGGIYSETILNYNNIGANYIRGQNFEVDVLSIHLNGTHNGVEIINNSTNIAATRFNKNNTGENEINGNTTIGNLVSQEIICNEISCNEISCNILNYNTLNPPINPSGTTNLTDLQDVCGVALNGDMFFYNATTSKYEFTNNIKNDTANNRVDILDLHIEALGTSSATNKIIVNTNLDLSNNSLISTDVSCETINTRNINSFTGGLFLNALGSGLNSTIKMNAEGTGTNSGVQIVNGAGGNGSTFFNYDNSGENYIRGRKLDVVNPEIILTAEETSGVNDGFIRLFAQGTGTNSGVQIRNGVGDNTIFNYQNSASNFIHGTTRFFNDIYIQKIIDASNSIGNFGAVLMSEGTGTNKWSNNPSLPNYLYMGGGGLNVGVSGQVLVSQHPLGFPTWIDAPAYNDTTKTLTITGNATYYGGNSVSLAGGNFGINFFSGINISSSNALFFDHIVGTFSPTSVRDGVYSLGSSPRRWSTVYATNGTINTSDDRLKINEKPITGALKLINNLEYYEYDKVKTLDGTDITHKERGVIAQQLINTDISFILSGGKIETIEDPIATTETKYIPYGVKYNDLFVTLCSAVKELSQLNKSLEARLLALESK